MQVSEQNHHLAALERWLVREYVAREFDSFARDPVFDLARPGLVPGLFHLLMDFPPFKPNAAEIKPLLQELFHAMRQDSSSSSSSSSSFIRQFLSPLVSGPLLSASRARRQSNDNTAVDIAASLLQQVSATPHALNEFLEELATAHAVEELRPSARVWLKQFTAEICREFAQGLSVKQEAFVTQQLPRKSMMAMLKSHSTTSATNCAMKFLFFRANGTSLFDQALQEALQVNRRAEVIEQARAQMMLAGEEEQHHHRARYLDLIAKQTRATHLLRVFQDKQVLQLLQQLVALTKANTMDLFFAKGSGMVRLVEDLFAAMDAVLVNKTLHASQLDRLWMRTLALVHNVLLATGQAPSDSLLCDTLHWYLAWFKLGLTLELDWSTWIAELESVEERDGIAREAKQCYDREVFNRACKSASDKLPRPANLEYSAKLLLPKLSSVLLDAMAALQANMTSPPPREAFSPLRQGNGSDERVLQDLEVLFHHSEQETWSALSKRGYVLCGRAKSASIWARFGSSRSNNNNGPIVDIQLVASEREEDIPPGYILLPKNLNKGALTGERLFLVYQRQAALQTARHAITGLEVLFSGVDERKKTALTQCGYQVACTFPTGVFATSQMWMRREQ